MKKYDRFIHTRIIDNRKIAPASYILSFEKQHDFFPGQVIYLSFINSEIKRIYSIASGINQNTVEILYKVNPDGKLTPSLAELMPGDNLMVSQPFGNFRIEPGPGICIANGTGIAPFASMFFSGFYQDKIIIHGSRYYSEFYYNNYFSEIQEKYIKCCSGELIDGTFYGRVTEYLRNDFDYPKEYKYYLCGSAEMVVEVRDILIEHGISINNIVTEIYF